MTPPVYLLLLEKAISILLQSAQTVSKNWVKNGSTDARSGWLRWTGAALPSGARATIWRWSKTAPRSFPTRRRPAGSVTCASWHVPCRVVFVIQRNDAACFSPHDEAGPAFGEALRQATHAGVQVVAWRCRVGREEIRLLDTVPLRLWKERYGLNCNSCSAGWGG